MSDKPIIYQTPPSLRGEANVEIKHGAFDALIWNNGYDVYHDKAIKCPCRSHNSEPLSTCRNCGGSGWLFINRTQTKMVLQSMNSNTKFKQWSSEDLGTVSITALDNEMIGFMDRITIIKGEERYSEDIYVSHDEIEGKTQLVARAQYDIVTVLDVFLFIGADKKLERLIKDRDFTVSKSFIIFNSRIGNYDGGISLTYTHRPTYHIIDIPRNVIQANVIVDNKKDTVKLPLHAIGRKAHYQLDRNTFGNKWLFDNSYQPGCLPQ